MKRIGGAPPPRRAQMGARGAAFSREQGRRTAANLRDVGVNVDLAPVLDVARPGGDDRRDRPRLRLDRGAVAATAVPFAAALQEVASRRPRKHFPGLGAARVNTDFAVQRIGLSKRTLRGVDEAPYRRFIAAGGEMVMLSTAIYPAFSPQPAAFARPIATGELRARLGFEGVSITDALGTVAVRDFGGPAKAGRGGGRRRRRPAPLHRLTGPRRRAQRALLRGAARPARSRRVRASRPRPSRVLRLRRLGCASAEPRLLPARSPGGSKTRTASRPASFAAYIAASASAEHGLVAQSAAGAERARCRCWR